MVPSNDSYLPSTSVVRAASSAKNAQLRVNESDSMVTAAVHSSQFDLNHQFDELSLETIETASVSFLEPRHTEHALGTPIPQEERETFRMKDRMKTVSVALVLCLNLGVDPPGVTKPNPCARLECWVDSTAENKQKTTRLISDALLAQYDRWQPRARYKTATNPTVDEVRRLCTSLRRNAKDERVLFHYNGHGVPLPTVNGEIWVFNKTFTQYIPLSIYDLQSWMGSPSVYVYDCHMAGLIVQHFEKFADDKEKEWKANLEMHRVQNGLPPLDTYNLTDSSSLLDLAQTYRFQAPPNFKMLPMGPELPADLFTSCLCTPIKTSVLVYCMHTAPALPALDLVERIPGQINDRRTPLGELNWIFTAVTDMIAWNTLPKDLFQRLFRQDLLVASLFRNYLLACRIMRLYKCTPVSRPSLPHSHDHSLWSAWDYALDLCVTQLKSQYLVQFPMELSPAERIEQLMPNYAPKSIQIENYQGSPFFLHQLQAFEVWLKCGGRRTAPPQQLPVVLQALLSQQHRVCALELLCHFLDLGTWAVRLALSVGIFPYVLKLLQSNVKDLRPLLAFIWAKILAVDPQCQHELVKEEGHEYFVRMCSDQSLSAHEKLVPAFVIAALVDSYRAGQDALQKATYVTTASELLADSQCQVLRLWLLIGLGRMWTDNNDVRWMAVRTAVTERVQEFVTDECPQVRAAAVFALGALVSNRSEDNEHATEVDHRLCMFVAKQCVHDSSPIVRREVVVMLHWLVLDFEDKFVTLVLQLRQEQKQINDALIAANSAAVTQSVHHSPHPNRSASTTTSAANMSMSRNIESMVSLHRERMSPAVESPLTVTGAGPLDPHLLRPMDTHSEQQPTRFTRYERSPSVEQTPLSPMYTAQTNAQDDSMLSNLKRSASTKAMIMGKLTGWGSTASSHRMKKTDTNTLTEEQNKQLLILNCIDILERRNRTSTMSVFGNVYTGVWLCLLRSCNDAVPSVSKLANTVVDYVMNRVVLLETQIAKENVPNEAAEGLVLSDQSTSDNALLGVTPPMAASASVSGSRVSNLASKMRASFLVGSPPPVTPTTSTDPVFGTGADSTDGAVAQATDGSGTHQVLSPAGNHGTNNAHFRNRSSSGKSCIPPPKMMPTFSPYAARYPRRRGRWDEGAEPATNINTGTQGISTNTNTTVPGRHRQSGATSSTSASSTLNTSQQCRRSMPLIETQFVQWCTTWFARPCWTTVQQSVMMQSACLESTATRRAVSDRASCQLHCAQTETNQQLEHIHQSPSGIDPQQQLLASTDAPIKSTRFVPLQSLILAGNSKNDLQFWDTNTGLSVGVFANAMNNPVHSHALNVEQLQYVEVLNPLNDPLLLTGTAGGIVRVWDVQLSAHCASHERVQGSQSPSLVMAFDILCDQPRHAPIMHTMYNWQQHSATLIAAGDVPVIRVWDAGSERTRCDLHLSTSRTQPYTASNTTQRHALQCTALATDIHNANAVFTGSSDGLVRMYDIRLPAISNLVVAFRDLQESEWSETEHKQSIVSVDACNDGRGLLAAMNAHANACVWDVRMFNEPIVWVRTSSSNRASNSGQSAARAMSVDWRAALMAICAPNTGVHIHSTNNGNQLSHLQWHQVLAGRQIDGTALAWHPYSTQLAVGSRHHLSVFRMVTPYT